MKLAEAIKCLQRDLLQPGSVPKLDFQDAEQLGIEAMKDRERRKASEAFPHAWLLPGETDE